MQIELLKCKIHRASVSESDLHYTGSIAIDRDLMDAAGLLEFEKVDVLNINNGERFTTYVIESPRGSGDIIINGAAARKVQKGDLVIICAFCSMDESFAKEHKPSLVYVDESNKIKS